MPDGRKNNGGAREGAGRPAKADELKLIETMDRYKNPDEVFDKLAELVEKGDRQAIKLWLNYRFGKPTDKIEVNSKNDMLTGFKVIRASND